MKRTLFDAIEDGDIIEVQSLLDAGASLDDRDVLEWTPLIYAVMHECPDAIRLLMRRGADPSAQDAFGRTAADYALREQYHEAISALTQD